MGRVGGEFGWVLCGTGICVNVFCVSVGLMEFYVLITIKTFYENAVSVSCWDFWIYNLHTVCVFVPICCIAVREWKGPPPSYVTWGVLFDGLPFCAVHGIFLIVWKVVPMLLTRIFFWSLTPFGCRVLYEFIFQFSTIFHFSLWTRGYWVYFCDAVPSRWKEVFGYMLWYRQWVRDGVYHPICSTVLWRLFNYSTVVSLYTLSQKNLRTVLYLNFNYIIKKLYSI